MTKKKEVIAYSYEQASEYARDILNNVNGKMPWSQFGKIIGVSYSSMMSFKYNIRPHVEMPHVVERILQFGYAQLEHRKEYIYTFDPKEFPQTLYQNADDPISYIEEVRLPDLNGQLQKLKKNQSTDKSAKLKTHIKKVQKEIDDMNLLILQLKKAK
ncbi:MAG: hypothetical protein KI791_21750 [Cyclobacteriaceae bacterium]|nr:hypothetical protein [Cyclobacteriaceae bacterium SS2]